MSLRGNSGAQVRAALALTSDPSWLNGDPVPLRVNPTTGALKTEVTGAGSGGTSAVDGDAFTAGSSALTPTGGVYDDAVADAISGKVGESRMTAKRALHVNLRDAAGAELGPLATPIRNQQVGTAATSVADGLNVVEGAVADVAVVGDNSGTISAKLRGINKALAGKLLVTPDSVALPANQSVNVSQINGVAPLMGAGNTGTGSPRVTIATDQAKVPVAGATASGSSLTAAPVTAGGLAKTALPTAVADAQVVDSMHDKFGRQVVVPQAPRDLVGTQTTTISASTSETTVLTAAAATFNDLVCVFIANTSATAVRVDFRDTTGGSVIFSVYAPAGATTGFVPSVPVPQTTVNTNWTAQSSASVTDLRVFVQFVKNK